MNLGLLSSHLYGSSVALASSSGAKNLYQTLSGAANVLSETALERGEMQLERYEALSSQDQALEDQFARASQVLLELVGTQKRSAERSLQRQLFELESVRTSMMMTTHELRQADPYPGIDDYLSVSKKRQRTLCQIEKRMRRGEPLSPRFQERWQRLRMSYLGSSENNYRSKWQQHLDRLAYAQENYPDVERPLLTDLLTQQEEYFNCLSRLAVKEVGHQGDIELTQRHRAERLELLRPYREAIEAFYMIMGHFSASERIGSIDRARSRAGMQWYPGMSWLPPMILGAFSMISAVAGIEPLSWDGSIFPTIEERWEDGVLVIEPKYKIREGESFSRRALMAGLLETIRFQFSLVNTVDIDPTGHNFDGIVPCWLYTVLAEAGATVRVEGLENLNGFRHKTMILAPTHRGFVEYPASLGLQDDIGMPHRIVAKDSFRTNPVIYNLVGEAMVAYNFIFIDREASKGSRGTMRQAGERVGEGKVSVLTYPSGSRSATLVVNGQRIEGPHYQSRTGIGDMARVAGDDITILPIALDGTGRMAPKDIFEQSKGIAIGETMTIKIGKPFYPSELRSEGMSDVGHSMAVAAKVDEAHQKLSGKPTGPLYGGRAKATIFQANSLPDLRKAMKKRLKKKYRTNAVVFPFEKKEGEEEEIIKLLTSLKFPRGKSLQVYHLVYSEDGQLEFPSYRIERNESGEFSVIFP